MTGQVVASRVPSTSVEASRHESQEVEMKLLTTNPVVARLADHVRIRSLALS